jgi:hypothetical protein
LYSTGKGIGLTDLLFWTKNFNLKIVSNLNQDVDSGAFEKCMKNVVQNRYNISFYF